MPKYSVNSDGSVVITDESDGYLNSFTRIFKKTSKVIKMITVVTAIIIYIFTYYKIDENEMASLLIKGESEKWQYCYNVSVIRDNMTDHIDFLENYTVDLFNRMEDTTKKVQDSIEKFRRDSSY